ncbi:AEC family transporter [Novosphingobium sp. FSY-8]|uniref:AEC family transporter n=1 Tax=Novosphingobium ovatum TaxID=1908523 RepID=A0ABW9XDK1_9SPHN|nr:AEC family transporter [Novosphingobium ovatum]NBC36627.1 AEC family transporter [Novosphingobium ovatum]
MIAIITPVFLLIGLGFGIGRLGLFSPDHVRGFGRFVLLVALPALVFNALANTHISQVLRADYLVVYGLASLGSMGLGYAWFRLAAGCDTATAAVRGLGMSLSNTAFVGFPLATQLFGPAAAGPLAINLLVENIVIIPLTLTLIEASTSQHPHIGQTLATIGKGLLRTPILIAILLGGACSLAGVSLPPVLAKPVAMMAGASAPLALFTIGASLAGVSLHGRRGAIAGITVGKLLVHPALAAVLLWLIPVGDPVFATMVILAAAIPTASVFPIIAQRADDVETTSAALLVATAVSFVTLVVVMGMLGVHLPAHP